MVPRLCSRLAAPGTPPLGVTVWGREGLPLPVGAPEVWENVLTRATLRVSHEGLEPVLSLAGIFQHLPVALLAGVETP